MIDPNDFIPDWNQDKITENYLDRRDQDEEDWDLNDEDLYLDR